MNFADLKLQITSPETPSPKVDYGLWSTNVGRAFSKKKRSHSLVVEDTGRLNARRSSVPNEAFISINSPFG